MIPFLENEIKALMDTVKAFKLPKEHGDRLLKLQAQTGVRISELARRAIIFYLDHVEPGPHNLGVRAKEPRAE